MPSASTRESAATAARVLVCARTRRAARALVRLLPATWLVRAASMRKHNYTSSSSVIEASFKSFHASRFVRSQSISLGQDPASKATTKPTPRPSSYPRPFAVARFPGDAHARIQTKRNVYHRKPSRNPPKPRRARRHSRRDAKRGSFRETCDRAATRSMRMRMRMRLRAIHPTGARARRRDEEEEEKRERYVPVRVVDVLVCASILVYPAGVVDDWRTSVGRAVARRHIHSGRAEPLIRLIL